jgi:hypothetical protein
MADEDEDEIEIPERTFEQALEGLVSVGGAGPGGALRFYDAEGHILTPEQIARRPPPRKAPNIKLKFRARRD